MISESGSERFWRAEKFWIDVEKTNSVKQVKDLEAFEDGEKTRWSHDDFTVKFENQDALDMVLFSVHLWLTLEEAVQK